MGEREIAEEVARRVAQHLDGALDVIPRLSIVASAGDEPLGVARELLDAIRADAQAEVLCRDVLELMRLVEDRAAARGNYLAEVALADGGVGAQQMVVDDDDVSCGGALAHARDEAVVVARALGAQARLRRRG